MRVLIDEDTAVQLLGPLRLSHYFPRCFVKSNIRRIPPTI
jgi:hypothetical protein